jgi:sterol 3beta-glucosyltransferase
MRILLATIGTRGDVQPYLALAVGLATAGHQVAIATCERYAPWISRFGITPLALDDSLLTLLESPAGRLLIGQLDSVWGGVTAAASVLRDVRPMNERLVADAWAASEAWQPDVIVYHPKLFCMPAIAARRGVQAVLAPLVPMQVPTGDAPFWGMPRIPLGRAYNRATWHVVEALTQLGTRGYLRRWREQYDRDGRSRESSPSRVRRGVPVTVLHGYGDAVSPRPSDWPAHAHVSGYWFLNDAVGSDGSAWQPSPALLRFLERGPAPVYIGFGSMAGANPTATTQLILRAVARAGVRAVIARGWGGLVPHDTLPDAVFVVDEAPHAWLFSRMAAVVHHGGAGTTAAGLRAGCPTLICPFGLDQPFWGARIAALGAGPAPLPQKRMTADLLADSLTMLVAHTAYRTTARRIASAIGDVDGVETGVRIIEALHTTVSRESASSRSA